ncbi:spore coat protein [Marinicrinis sediminis]|uniref:Spore coat protein n=1 Tax=Marinicrinis sediminis TaxID=1652465 RepID=A0ABW5R9V8_9BACL
MTAQSSHVYMPDSDALYTILADLKRVCREYTTAATESNCQVVRQMFQDLLQDGLHMQGELYQFMNQQQMYNTSSPVLRQELDKQVKQYMQTQQQTEQWIQQHASSIQSATSYMQPVGSYSNEQSVYPHTSQSM